MRILFVSDVSIAHRFSGSERVLYEESTRLAKRGHDVFILTRRLAEHKSQMEEVNGVRECRYRLAAKKLYPFLKSSFIDCRRLFTYLYKNIPFHIINFHQPFSAVGVLASRASHRIPLIYTCHSLSFKEYMSRSSLPMNSRGFASYRLQLLARKLVEKAAMHRSNHVVVLSEYTRRKLEEEYGLHPRKIRVIPGGVDLNRFKPSQDKATVRRQLAIPESSFIFFTVRNLEPRMGLENLILAFKKIVDNQAQALLILGGAGPLDLELKSLAGKVGLADAVRFIGYIPDEELPSYYQMADLFILPTKELEGFGLVTLEALASGLPVLGTPVGGTKEILAHMGSEFLFADSTSDSMAKLILETMQAWAKNPEIYNQISRKCRMIAEKHYSWDAHITELKKLLQFTIQQSRSSYDDCT